MYVYLFAESRAVHCRTLYVPARSAVAPGGRPAYFPLLSRLPQREVGGIPLLFAVVYAHAVQHILNRSVGKATVALKTRNVKIHVAVARGICLALFNQSGNKVDYIVDILGSFKPHSRLVYRHIAHNRVYVFNSPPRVFVRRYARFFRAGYNFIVHVGIVARVRYCVALLFQILAHYIVYKRLKAVPYMRLARYGYAAGVHLYLALFERLKLFLSPRQRVVYPHRPSPHI